MIAIVPISDAHALLIIAAMNEWLQTGFIGGQADGVGGPANAGGGGWGYGDGEGDGGIPP